MVNYSNQILERCISIVKVGSKFVGLQCAKGRGIIFPGGRWEKGETYGETAKRELLEETGLVATKQKFVFGAMGPDLNYCFSFLTEIENYLPIDSKEGKVVLADWSDFLESFFRPYYLLLKEVLD